MGHDEVCKKMKQSSPPAVQTALSALSALGSSLSALSSAVNAKPNYGKNETYVEGEEDEIKNEEYVEGEEDIDIDKRLREAMELEEPDWKALGDPAALEKPKEEGISFGGSIYPVGDITRGDPDGKELGNPAALEKSLEEGISFGGPWGI